MGGITSRPPNNSDDSSSTTDNDHRTVRMNNSSLGHNATCMKLAHSFPSFYIVRADVDEIIVANANSSWNKIAAGNSPEYLKFISEVDSSQTPSPAVWFSNCFYSHLFEVSPHTRRQFESRDMISQGPALVDMIAACLKLLDMLDNRAKWKRTLRRLAKAHAVRGVMAAQYGTFGEALFWTLEHCLGTDYTEHTWLSIYSLMLKTIIPTAIEEEKKIASHKAHIDYEAEARLQKCSSGAMSARSNSSSFYEQVVADDIEDDEDDDDLFSEDDENDEDDDESERDRPNAAACPHKV